MKKNFYIVLFTFLLNIPLQAMYRIPFKINPKVVSTAAALASAAYGYTKKDAIQEKAVQKSLEVIDTYAKPEKKDVYFSTVFNGLKAYKPSLLPLMKDHYNTRFADHIKNHRSPLLSEKQSLQEYSQVIASQITQINENIIEYLIDNNYEAHKLFTDHAISYPSLINQDLTYLLLTNPQEAMVQDLEKIIDDRLFSNSQWQSDYAQSTKKLLTTIQENFADVNPEVLNMVLLTSFKKDVQNSFVDLTIKHPTKKYAGNYIIRLCDKALNPTKDDVKRLEKIATSAYKNFNVIDQSTLDNLFVISPKLANDFTDKVIENIQNVEAEILSRILQKASYTNRGRILDTLHTHIHNREQGHINTSLTAVINANNCNAFKLIDIYNQHAKWFRKPLPLPPVPSHLTQSEVHALIESQKIKKCFGEALNNPVIKTFAETIHLQEKIEQQQGRMTFVHGCSWNWDFKQDLFTRLMECKYNKSFDNYRFMRFKSDYSETIEDTTMHEKLDTNKAHELRSDVLFMNHGLFGNINNFGSCTFHYWLKDFDQSVNNDRNHIDIQELFEKASMQEYFERYKKDIQKLEKLHTASKNKGLLLLISTTPSTSDHYTYITTVGAGKRSLTTNDYTTLSKTSEAVNHLKNNPMSLGKYADKTEYGMLLSNKYALNPEKAGKDIKIFPFSLAHGTKEYKAYCQKRDELINKIKQDMQETQNPALKKERINFQVLSTFA